MDMQNTLKQLLYLALALAVIVCYPFMYQIQTSVWQSVCVIRRIPATWDTNTHMLVSARICWLLWQPGLCPLALFTEDRSRKREKGRKKEWGKDHVNTFMNKGMWERWGRTEPYMPHGKNKLNFLPFQAICHWEWGYFSLAFVILIGVQQIPCILYFFCYAAQQGASKCAASISTWNLP